MQRAEQPPQEPPPVPTTSTLGMGHLVPSVPKVSRIHCALLDTCFGVVVTHACGTKHWHTIEFFWAMPMGFGNYNCRFGTIKVFFVSISTNTCIFPLELVGCAVGKTLRGSRRVWLIKHRNNWLAGGTNPFHLNQTHLIESMHLKVMALRGLGEST